MMLSFDYKELIDVFGSNSYALEVFLVLVAKKPCCRNYLNFSRLPTVIEFCRVHNLAFEMADYASKFIDNPKKLGFGGREQRISLDQSDKNLDMVCVYIAKDSATALQAKRSDTNGDDIHLGKILGYPECCIEFYENNKQAVEKNNMDFTLIPLNEVKQFSYLLNIALMPFGIAVISHFPCSLDCKSTQSLATGYIQVLRTHYPDLAAFIEINLKSAVIFTEQKGIFYTPEYKLDGKHLFFQNMKCSTNNEISMILNKSKELIINTPHNISVGTMQIEGEDMGIFLFS